MMNPTVAQWTSTMVFWLSVMVSKRAKITGLSRTPGVQNGEMKVIFRYFVQNLPEGFDFVMMQRIFKGGLPRKVFWLSDCQQKVPNLASEQKIRISHSFYQKTYRISLYSFLPWIVSAHLFTVTFGYPKKNIFRENYKRKHGIQIFCSVARLGTFCWQWDQSQNTFWD